MAQQRRMIYGKIFSSHSLNSLPIEARFLYIGTLVLADDDGRLNGNPKYLKGQIFSYDEQITSEMVRGWRDEMVKINQIELYTSDGNEYISHPKWKEYQFIRKDRMSRSMIPSPKKATSRLPIAGIGIPKDVLDAVYKRDGEECFYCGADRRPFCLDHVLPESRGGESTAENLVVCCIPCNRSKGDYTPEEWRHDDVNLTTKWGHKLNQIKLNKVKQNNTSPAKEDGSFDIFWAAYPRKESKKKALNTWNTKKIGKHINEILAFIEKAKKTERWIKGYIPHATTFLNGERWQDDISSYAGFEKKEAGMKINKF